MTNCMLKSNEWLLLKSECIQENPLGMKEIAIQVFALD